MAIVIVAMMLILASSATSDGPMYSRQERIGFAFVSEVPTTGGIMHQSLSDYETSKFGAGWYSDWKYTAHPDMPADQTIEYAQLVRVSDGAWPPNWQAITDTAQANPGALWLIGNEPECRNQDNLTPEVYAERYHELYTRIKAIDSTAKLANGGIVEPTPLRMIWLDQVLAHYLATFGEDMPVDVWNIHMQILREWAGETSCADDPEACKDGATIPQGLDPVADGTAHLVYNPLTVDETPDYTVMVDSDVFSGMIVDFRQWMKDNGQQQKPLIISEMGVLYPSEYVTDREGTEQERKEYGDQAIEAFMRATYAWMLDTKDGDLGFTADENLLVQRWLWFSLNDSFYTWENPDGFNGSLVDYETQELTRFGETFMDIQRYHRMFLPVLIKAS